MRVLLEDDLVSAADQGRPATESASAVESTVDRSYWVGLGLLVVLGALVRIAFAITDDALTNDATAYLEAGANLVTGNGFIRDGSPELHFPPVTPLLLGGAWGLVGDARLAYGIVTVVVGTFVLLPMAAIARRLGGDRAGWLAAGFGALVPALAAEPALAGGGSEAPYLLFVLTALWTFGRWVDERHVHGTRWAAATGGAIGLAYLTRPEAMLIAAGLGLLLLAVAGWHAFQAPGRRPTGVVAVWPVLRHAGAFGVAILVLAVPYLAYLHGETGSWSPTAKSQDASIEAWRAVAEGERRDRDAVLYALDDTGLAFSTERTSLTGLARENPGEYRSILATNAGQLSANFAVPIASNSWAPRWVLVPLPLALLGLWAAGKRRRDPAVLALVGAGGSAVVTGLVFFVQPRYLLPAGAVLAILGAVGVASLRRPGWRTGATVVAALLLVAPYVADIGRSSGYWDRREQVEHQMAGDWLVANAATGDRVMTRAMVVAFASELDTVALPDASIEDTVAFAQHYGVEWIVIDEFNLRTLRPQFDPLFGNDPVLWGGLEVATEFTYRGRLTRIYAVPQVGVVSEDDPPGLGFVGDA